MSTSCSGELKNRSFLNTIVKLNGNSIFPNPFQLLLVYVLNACFMSSAASLPPCFAGRTSVSVAGVCVVGRGRERGGVVAERGGFLPIIFLFQIFGI